MALIALGFQTQIVAGTYKQQKNIFCKLVTTLMNGYFLILGVFIHIEILSYFHSENKKQFSICMSENNLFQGFRTILNKYTYSFIIHNLTVPFYFLQESLTRI